MVRVIWLIIRGRTCPERKNRAISSRPSCRGCQFQVSLSYPPWLVSSLSCPPWWVSSLSCLPCPPCPRMTSRWKMNNKLLRLPPWWKTTTCPGHLLASRNFGIKTHGSVIPNPCGSPGSPTITRTARHQQKRPKMAKTQGQIALKITLERCQTTLTQKNAAQKSAQEPAQIRKQPLYRTMVKRWPRKNLTTSKATVMKIIKKFFRGFKNGPRSGQNTQGRQIRTNVSK